MAESDKNRQAHSRNGFSSDPMVFRSSRDFAAWIGLVPRQDSTGGKQKLGPI
jgi:transposase